MGLVALTIMVVGAVSLFQVVTAEEDPDHGTPEPQQDPPGDGGGSGGTGGGSGGGNGDGDAAGDGDQFYHEDALDQQTIGNATKEIRSWLGSAAGGASVMALGGLNALGVMVAYKRRWRELTEPIARPAPSPPPKPAAATMATIRIRCLSCGYIDSEDAQYCSKCSRPMTPQAFQAKERRASGED